MQAVQAYDNIYQLRTSIVLSYAVPAVSIAVHQSKNCLHEHGSLKGFAMERDKRVRGI
jgi:hypothetical protein